MGRPSLNDQFVEINSKWDDSAPQRALIRFIKRTVLPLESLTVHSALCLGLGSMENGGLTLLRGPAKDPHAVDSQEVPISWEDEAPSDEDDAEAVKPISCGVHLNSSLYQLAFFETVLLTLREKSLINTVQFQDPAFTHADREFLQQRGYTVLPWSSGTGPKSKPCDPVVLESVRESTFFFAPYLDRPVVAQVICAGMLSLFLGHDLLLEIVYPATRNQNVEQLERYIFAHGFRGLKFLGLDEFGLMWPVDLTDENVLARQQIRLLQVQELEQKYGALLQRRRPLSDTRASSGAMR